MGVEVHPMDTNQQQAHRQAAQDLKRLQKKIRSLDHQIAKVEEVVRTLTASTSTHEKSAMFSSSRTLPDQSVFICPPQRLYKYSCWDDRVENTRVHGLCQRSMEPVWRV
jgi:hypothetical protein